MALTGRARVSVAMGDASHLEVRRLVESGALRPVLDQTFPLAGIAAAHERLERAAARDGRDRDPLGSPGHIAVVVAPAYRTA